MTLRDPSDAIDRPVTPLTIVGGILALAAVVRISVAIVLPDQGPSLGDIATYREAAHQLATSGLMTDTTKMPLYPLLIAIMGPGLGQLTADIVLSVIMVWLVHALTWELFADRIAAAAAALVAACYLPLAFFAVVGLSETLFITLMLGAFVGWYRGAFFAASICAVLAILTRPIFDAAAPLLIVAFALLIYRLSIVQTVKRLLAYAVVYVALMAPWWVHNYRHYGSFVRLNPNLGLVLYAGNNPRNRTGGGNEDVDYDRRAFREIKDPLARDRALRDAAIAYIVSDPAHFVKMAGLKFLRFWRLWPENARYSNPLAIAVSVLSIVPVLLLAGVGAFLARRELRRLSPVLLFGAGYTLLHMALVGTIRYRLPLEPFLICFSGVAISAMLRTMAPRWIAAQPVSGQGVRTIMSVRRLAPPEQQPKNFAFTAENAEWAKKIVARYPAGRQQSAIIPLLWRAQEQNGGWLPEAAIRHVGEMLDMAHIRALEVATFYTMFLLEPCGKKAHVQVCGTTPCMLRGAQDILDVCKRRIHHDPHHVSANGDFSWEEVECLGACVNAPMVLIWNDTYEDLTAESFEKVLDGFASGKPVKPGPQIDRQLSAPVGGPTTLKSVKA